MKWVGENSSIPLTKIVAYGSHRDNIIGFENITMDFVKGEPPSERWRYLQRPAKIRIAEQLAIFQYELYQHKHKAIGNLYWSKEAGYFVGTLISDEFFRRGIPPPHAPCTSSKSWLDARLNFCINAQEHDLKQETKSSAIQTLEKMKTLAKYLLEIPELLLPDYLF